MSILSLLIVFSITFFVLLVIKLFSFFVLRTLIIKYSGLDWIDAARQEDECDLANLVARKLAEKVAFSNYKARNLAARLCNHGLISAETAELIKRNINDCIAETQVEKERIFISLYPYSKLCAGFAQNKNYFAYSNKEIENLFQELENFRKEQIFLEHIISRTYPSVFGAKIISLDK